MVGIRSLVEKWSDDECEDGSRSVAGKLSGVCVCTLCMEIGISRCIGNTNLRYAVSKKDWPSENCGKV